MLQYHLNIPKIVSLKPDNICINKIINKRWLNAITILFKSLNDYKQ